MSSDIMAGIITGDIQHTTLVRLISHVTCACKANGLRKYGTVSDDRDSTGSTFWSHHSNGYNGD